MIRLLLAYLLAAHAMIGYVAWAVSGALAYQARNEEISRAIRENVRRY